MTNEQKRQIAEETALALRRSLKERSIGGFKIFSKGLGASADSAASARGSVYTRANEGRL